MIEAIEYETLLSRGAFICSAVLCHLRNRQYLILMFRGQKTTNYGQSSMNAILAVCCNRKLTH